MRSLRRKVSKIIMEHESSDRYRDKEREAKAIKKDIATARGLIADSLLRYKKKMLRARSKKDAGDLSVFAALDGYESLIDIQDAYGWEFISEAEYDRLSDMWEAREQFITDSGKFENRVTLMLERAMRGCGDEYMDTRGEFGDMKRKLNDDIQRIERENRDKEYARRRVIR